MSSTSAEVEVSRKGAVLTVMMNRPEKRNAMSSTMLARLHEVFRGLADDQETRVVVVRGAGRSFCTGLDLAELAAARASGAGVELTAIEDVFHVLERVPQPTIAMVHGESIAGGCELALHCDLRIAAEDVKFAMPLARLGIVIPFPLIQKLLDTLGTAHTKELLYTGDFFHADRALALHMVNRLVPAAELEATAYALAEKIAGNAPLSVRAFKKVIFRANEFRRTIDAEEWDAEIARIGKSEDAIEGVAAMREKRKPQFKGR